MGVLGSGNGKDSLLLKIWGIILLATAIYLLPLLLAKLNPFFNITLIFHILILVFFTPLILLAWLAGIILTIALLYAKLKEEKTKVQESS